MLKTYLLKNHWNVVVLLYILHIPMGSISILYYTIIYYINIVVLLHILHIPIGQYFYIILYYYITIMYALWYSCILNTYVYCKCVVWIGCYWLKFENYVNWKNYKMFLSSAIASVNSLFFKLSKCSPLNHNSITKILLWWSCFSTWL